MSEFRKEINSENEVFATIAYDAATVDPGDSDCSNLFVFNLQPLNASFKSRIVHIALNSTGKTDQSIKEVIDQINEAAKECNVHLLFISTDGETGTNSIHRDFGKFINDLELDDFDEILDRILDYPDLIPVSDWLHLLKDLRKRFGENNISMFKGAPIFNSSYINEFLNLDNLVLKASGPSSMRDDLALHLFNTKNLEILAENEEFCCFAFLFPFTIVTVAIQSENLTSQARYTLVKIAYKVICELNECAAGIRSKTSKKSPNIDVRFALRMSCQRTLNSLIALGFSLKFFHRNLSISRLFTHTVEYIFGYMRRLSYGKDQVDISVNALAKQDITKDTLKKYNLDSIHIRGRIAASEDGIEEITSKWKLDIIDVSHDQITEEIIQLMHGSMKFENTQTAKLLYFICQNTPSIIPSLNTKKRIGDSIRSRQQAYNSTKK